jgi:Galactose-3-O-sulfotransferase
MRFVTGHVPAGIRDQLAMDGVPTISYTVLRDPFERVLSHFHFLSERGDIPHIRSIEAFLEHDDTRGVAQNLMVFFVNVKFTDDGEWVDAESYYDADQAKRSLDQFHTVGTVERLGDSMGLLHHAMGWKPMRKVPHVNTSKRPAVASLSRSTWKRIYELNVLDAELYEHAKDREASQRRIILDGVLRGKPEPWQEWASEPSHCSSSPHIRTFDYQSVPRIDPWLTAD